MRVQLLAVFLATAVLAACGGQNASDTSAASIASVGVPTSLPATVEGEIFFDLAEAEQDEASLTAADEVLASIDAGGEDGAIDVLFSGDQIKGKGLNGDGERVRVRLVSKRDWHGNQVYKAGSLAKL